jgi:hypothetical protein
LREDNVRKIWSEAELDAALADLHSDVGADDGLAFARASLLSAAGVEEAPPAGPRRSGAWRWLAVAAAVVTLVGGLGVAAALWTPDAPLRPAAALSDLDRPLAPGEFRYAQKLEWATHIVDGRPAKAQRRVELWVPADPTGVWHRRTTWQNVARPDGEERTGAPASGPVDEYGPGGVFPSHPDFAGQTRPTWNTPFQNWLTPDAAFLASLAPDRGTLVKRLNFDTIEVKESGKLHSATTALTMVRSALETGLVPKDVRFALRDAFSQVVRAFVVPGQTPDGRPATVLGAKDTGQHLYLDPATAQLLAWDTPAPPKATSSSEVIRSLTQTPPSSESVPVTSVTTRPDSPQPDRGEPATVYSFAITRTSG